MFRSVAGVAGLIARLSAQHGIPYALHVPQRHGRTLLPAIHGKSQFLYNILGNVDVSILLLLLPPEKREKTSSSFYDYLRREIDVSPLSKKKKKKKLGGCWLLSISRVLLVYKPRGFFFLIYFTGVWSNITPPSRLLLPS